MTPAVRPSPRLPGTTVPGSQVGLPSQARAGSVVEGIAPTGSRVEAAGQVLHVGSDRRFTLRVPADARDTLPVRIVLPGDRSLLLRVRIAAD